MTRTGNRTTAWNGATRPGKRKPSDQALLHAIIQGSPIPQFVIGSDHRVLYWNQALEQYSGVTAAQVVGSSRQWSAFYDHARPLLADILVEGRLDLLEEYYSGKYFKSPYVNDAFVVVDYFPHMKPGGKWLHFTAVAIRDENGSVIGAVETLEDVTERITTQEELMRVNRVQSLILDNSAVGIAFIRNRIFEWVNPQLPAMLGRSAHELLGASTRMIYISEEEYAEVGRQAYQALGQGRWFEFVLTMPRSDGTTYIGRILGKALDAEHPGEGSIWIFEDITRRRELEEHIRRSDKLAALGQLAVGIAHEVRNPLGSIRGFALIVQRDLPPDDPLQRFVEIIIKESERLGMVTQELLDFARPARVEFACISINRLVEKALFLVEIDMTACQVEFVRKLDEAVLNIYGSEEKLIQVLLNLLQNAMQAIGDRKGVITIETRKANDSWAELKISDTGEGILPENLNKLFDPFFTTRNAGTGLGLTIVHQIMHRHGGRIQVNSRYRQGTSIVLKFPLDSGT